MDPNGVVWNSLVMQSQPNVISSISEIVAGLGCAYFALNTLGDHVISPLDCFKSYNTTDLDGAIA